MKKTKIFAALALSACMALGVFGLAACQKGDDGAAGKSAYEIAVDNGFNGTEQEWLDSLKGSASGSQGKSAYDIWLENGHTGSEADFLEWLKGDKGDKGDKGEQGEKGDDGATGNPGTAGKDGSTWLVGSTDPYRNDGKDGDLYLNITTWDVWRKVSGEWTLLGNIKGADGTGSGSEDTQNVIMNFGAMTLTAGEQKCIIGTGDFDSSAIANGNYFFVAETESAPANGKLSIIHTFNSANKPTDMFMPLSNKYQCFFPKSDNTYFVYIKNDTDSELKVTGLKLVEYVAPTIEAGKEVEVFTNAPGVIDVPFDIDPSLAGKNVTITISNWVNTTTTKKYVNVVDGVDPETIIFAFTASHYNEGVFEMTGTIPAGTTSLVFRDLTNKQNRNIAVKIEVVA